MNAALLEAIIALVPASLLFAYSVAVFARRRTPGSSLQLFGAGCFVIVVLTHVCEALRLFPLMKWGEPNSVGHFVDLSSAALGITLLPVGFALRIVFSNPSGQS